MAKFRYSIRYDLGEHIPPFVLESRNYETDYPLQTGEVLRVSNIRDKIVSLEVTKIVRQLKCDNSPKVEDMYKWIEVECNVINVEDI